MQESFPLMDFVRIRLFSPPRKGRVRFVIDEQVQNRCLEVFEQLSTYKSLIDSLPVLSLNNYEGALCGNWRVGSRRIWLYFPEGNQFYLHRVCTKPKESIETETFSEPSIEQLVETLQWLLE